MIIVSAQDSQSEWLRAGKKPQMSNPKVEDLTVTYEDIFWINKTTKSLWSMNRGEVLNKNISKISLYCPACQILPISQKICLVPEDFKVAVFNKTSEKIGLQIQPLKFNPKCDILMPQIQLNIKYKRKFDNNGFKPKTFTMLDNSRIQNIAIDNLTAFKEYDLEISASSILGDLIMEPVKFEIKTLEGAPSPPNNVTGMS